MKLSVPLTNKEIWNQLNKNLIKRNLDAISQDLSSLRCQKLKPALHPKCAGLCDLEYTDAKQLLGGRYQQKFS